MDSDSQEMAQLRAELIRAKNDAENERLMRMNCEKRLLDMEQKLNKLCGAGKMAEKKEAQKNASDEISSLKSQVKNLKDQIKNMTITHNQRMLLLFKKRAHNKQSKQVLQECRKMYQQARQKVVEMQLEMVQIISYAKNKQLLHMEFRRRAVDRIISLKENYNILADSIQSLQNEVILLKLCYAAVYPKDKDNTNK